MAGKSMQNFLESPVTAPLLKSSMTGLIGWISIQKIFPGSTGPQNPQDAIEHIARVTPWPSPAIWASLRLRKKRLDELPLFFGKVHALSLRGGTVMTVRGFVLRGAE